MASELNERVPFALAIAAPKLLKPRFDSLSLPQRTILKAFYGLPLTEEELVFWSVSQGGATYDDLGYVTGVVLQPYIAKEYDFLNLYVGRRSGKTDKVISTAAAYEITLGGHTRYAQTGQELKVPFIAQGATDAMVNMNFIKLAVESSPLLRGQLAVDQVASEIRFKNGIIVDPMPASKAVGRGHGIPVFIGDETAFWHTDVGAANPDFEVLRALAFAMAQFPDAKTLIGTTPWAEEGVAFKNWKAGTEGKNLRCEPCRAAQAKICEHATEAKIDHEGILVIHASTAAMANPLITRKRLIQIRNRDREAFPRESLAQTLKSVAGWLNLEKLAKSITEGVMLRPADLSVNAPIYTAAIDPAFRKDSFAFTIAHHDHKLGMVQDYIQYWEPQIGQPLKPGVILDEIKLVLDAYKLQGVYSDQYQLESLQQLALDRGFSINGYDFTGKSKAQATGSFQVLLNQERVKLLDNEVQTGQLQSLQRKVMQTGNVQISAAPGKHDDLAMVLILVMRILVWLLADLPTPKEPILHIDTDHVKMVMAGIDKKRREARAEAYYDE
jgi:hypothetical protein